MAQASALRTRDERMAISHAPQINSKRAEDIRTISDERLAEFAGPPMIWGLIWGRTSNISKFI
jgi:hypothetical protein